MFTRAGAARPRRATPLQLPRRRHPQRPRRLFFVRNKSATTSTAAIYLAQGLMEADTAKRLIRAVEGTCPSSEVFPLVLEGASAGTGWTIYTASTTQAPPTWNTDDPLVAEAAARRIAAQVQSTLDGPECEAYLCTRSRVLSVDEFKKA